MKLFLASEAKHPDSMAALDKFVGGLSGKSIAYIPTAANAEEGYGVWQKGGSWKTVNNVGAQVKALVLEEYLDNRVLKEIEKADIIWFGGGLWVYLMYWVQRCEIDKHIVRWLTKGKIYVGSSAGANIASPTIELASWYMGFHEPGAEVFPGLSLIDFDIYPHYSDDQLGYIQEHYKGNKMYLLKNGEAITVEDDEVIVLGEERIINND